MIEKQDVKQIQAWANTIKDSVEKVFFGKEDVIEKILVGFLCKGHILIEDIPGLGKTILARAIATSLGGKFKRIQCTPDLLPADVIGLSVYNPKNGTFMFKKGPVHSNIILVDEINRATPRTQSALLEAMAEFQVTVEGRMVQLPDPFFIIATENPVEFEGTFPLPEAQKDRFFMTLKIGYPPRDAEALVLETQKRTTHPVNDLTTVTNIQEVVAIQQKIVNIHVAESIRNYILDIVGASRDNTLFQLGVSPRGSIALYKGAQALAAIRGRDYVIPEDIKELAIPILTKRIILSSDQLIKGVTEEDALRSVLESVKVPVIKDAL